MGFEGGSLLFCSQLKKNKQLRAARLQVMLQVTIYITGIEITAIEVTITYIALFSLGVLNDN